MNISFNTFPSSSVARVTAVDQKPGKYSENFSGVERRLMLFGEPSDEKDVAYNIPKRILSPSDKVIYGYGSELAAMIDAAFSYNPEISIYAVPVKAEAGGKEATATIGYTGTAAGSGEISFYIAGQKITVRVLANDSAEQIAVNTVARIMDNINLPCVAEVSTEKTQVKLKAKWKGVTSNQIVLKEIKNTENSPSGVLTTVSSFSGGTGTLSLKDAFQNFGDIWYTMAVLPVSDEDNLNVFSEFAEKMSTATECKAFQYVVGRKDNRAAYISFIEKRNDKHLTAMFVENSLSPEYIIAASAGAYMENAHAQCATASYSSELKKVIPPIETKIMEFSEKDAIVKMGGCTTEVRSDNLVYFENTVTTYKKNTAGISDDSFRYPQVWAAYQEVAYNTKRRFMLSPFDRAVVVDDNAITSSVFAVKPIQVKATMKSLIKSFADNALIRDIEESFKTVVCEIDSGNAARINYRIILYFALPLEQKAFMFEWTTEAVA